MFKKAADLLDFLERKGISIANFAKQSGVSANRIHLWKAGRGNPKGEDAVLIQNWYNAYIKEDVKEIDLVHTKESTTKEKESELQALLSITQVYAESHLGLVRSHEILNQNHTTALAQNEELIKLVGKDKGQKINLNSSSNGQPMNQTFVRLLGEFLAKRYSLNENDLFVDIGNTLSAFQASKLSSDSLKNG